MRAPISQAAGSLSTHSMRVGGVLIRQLTSNGSTPYQPPSTSNGCRERSQWRESSSISHSFESTCTGCTAIANSRRADVAASSSGFLGILVSSDVDVVHEALQLGPPVGVGAGEVLADHRRVGERVLAVHDVHCHRLAKVTDDGGVDRCRTFHLDRGRSHTTIPFVEWFRSERHPGEGRTEASRRRSAAKQRQLRCREAGTCIRRPRPRQASSLPVRMSAVALRTGSCQGAQQRPGLGDWVP